MGAQGVAVGRLGELANDLGTAREYLIFAALYWALPVYRVTTRALDQGGVEPRPTVCVRPEGHPL